MTESVFYNLSFVWTPALKFVFTTPKTPVEIVFLTSVGWVKEEHTFKTQHYAISIFEQITRKVKHVVKCRIQMIHNLSPNPHNTIPSSSQVIEN